MTAEEAHENGYEFFTSAPPCIPLEDGKAQCWWCHQWFSSGWLEMEADTWFCADCFAQIIPSVYVIAED